MGLTILGIFLLIYGVFCLFIAITKWGPVWKMAKIEGFKKILGELGTQIFIGVWGAVALGFGIWLTFIK